MAKSTLASRLYALTPLGRDRADSTSPAREQVPVTRQHNLELFSQGPDLLRAALREFPREMWQWKPAPNKWSIHEIVIHLTDAEVNSSVRARRIIAEPGKSVMEWDQDRWAFALGYHGQDVEDALELFRLCRKTTMHLLKAIPESTWRHTVTHPEIGALNLEQWLHAYAEHVPTHIRQMWRNYEAWRRGE